VLSGEQYGAKRYVLELHTLGYGTGKSHSFRHIVHQFRPTSSGKLPVMDEISY